MRIALLTPGFSASEDDGCIPALLDLVRALSAVDDVTLFALRYPHHRRPYTVHGARVVPLGGAATRGPRRLALFWRALSAIRRHAPFDVLHAFWAHEPGFLATFAGHGLATKVVVSLMGGELADLPDIDYGGRRTLVNLLLVRRALARADAVTVGSEFLRQQFLRRQAQHGPPCHLLPLGVDTERFQPTGEVAELEGDPKLLHVASLVPVKDQATLLAAFAALKQPDARLHLVGDGPLRGELEGRARALGIGDRVCFHGAVDHGRLPAFYRGADLCVLASRFESQAMVALEAAACDRLTVGTAVGMLPELGPTVPPADPTALAELLGLLLADRARLAERGREAGRTVRRRHSLSVSVERWRELYATLGRA